ncbi:uncharacterized protein LOC127137387 [Lathyrus oleraceus]|uniref:uncharacterized protein LOC127137387 n=1 Tax=Pisum sativum TaxID=3888 RepID=UPI0021CE5C81|nr:uncharacterized protein LOC127137387 [Pisum sativum]
MLETQISQVAQQQAASTTPGGSFYGQPQTNPKDPRLNNKPKPQEGNVVTTSEKQAVEKLVEPVKPREEEVKDKKEVNGSQVYVLLPPYKPLVPYRQILKQTKQYTQYKKFVKVFEKLHVEIPFTKVITQIPSYAKFLKDILTNKSNLDDPKPLECNAIAENKVAKKEKDLERFSIPCVLGRHVIDKALLDLCASVSMMPLAVCNRLNLRDIQLTRMPLQLVDRSVKYPISMLEDIPDWIGQLYISIDVFVMDIKEDEDILILIGRPFLSTVGAIIDVKRVKMTFEVGDEKVEFIISKFLKATAIDASCCAIHIVDECIRELDKESPTETIKLPSTPIMEDDGFKSMTLYMDDSLYECLALT